MEDLLRLTNELRNETTKNLPPRDTDHTLTEFLNDQENPLNLSDQTVKRLLLLNKRRKDHAGPISLVYDEGESRLTHLEDCFEIMKLVGPEIRRSALVHDIGKTGPLNVDEKTSKIIMAVFAEIHEIDTREGSVEDLIKKIFNNQDERNDAIDLLRKADINTDMSLNQFYPMHVEWGAQILQDESGLSPREKFIALNHHQMGRGKGINIDGYIPDETAVKQTRELELADFYQADRSRGQKSSVQAQDRLRHIFIEKIPLDELNILIDKIATRDKKSL